MTIQARDIQKIYLAYFGRPADPAGLTYWQTRPDLLSVANAFAQTAEYQALYAADDFATLVDNVYLNLFRRSPDPQGKAFWVKELSEGKVLSGEAALAILEGARGTDLQLLGIKLNASEAFTDRLALTTLAAAYKGSGPAAQAREAWAEIVSAATVPASFDPLIERLESHWVDGVQRLYVAYYGRPADPAGLDFWVERAIATGGDWETLARQFSDSAESRALYAGTSDAALVDAIYLNVLGRLPEAAGRAYWVERLEDGSVSPGAMALAIARSTQGSDTVTLTQRIDAAKAFTLQLEVDGRDDDYSTGTVTAVAREWIYGIGPDADDLAAALQVMPDLVNSFVEGQLRGIVVNGYIADATVFVDENGNGRLDPGEVSVVSDASGNFVFPEGRPAGPVIALGGTNITTGEPNTAILKAPSGSAVVTPLTNLVQQIIENDLGVTQEDAENLIFSALGIPKVDLSYFDPLKYGLFGTPAEQAAALQIEAVTTQVANTLAMGGAVLQGAGLTPAQARQSMLDALVFSIASGTVDLTQPGALSTVMASAIERAALGDEAAARAEAAVGDVARVLSEINTRSDRAADAFANGVVDDPVGVLSDMFKLATLVQSELAGAVEQATSTGATGPLATEYTGTNLTRNVDEVIAGNINADTPTNDGTTITNGGTPGAFEVAVDVGGDDRISGVEATVGTVLRVTVTSGTLAGVRVSGIRATDGSPLVVEAVFDPASGRHLFDATLFRDGSLQVIFTSARDQTVSANLLLDTTAPGRPSILSVTDDAVPVVGALADGATTNDVTPTVRVGLAGTGVVPGDSVQLFNGTLPLGGAVVLTAADIAAGYRDLTTPALADGASYDLRASLTDALGNQGTRSRSGEFDITVDTAVLSAPRIASVTDDTAPVTGPLSSGARTNDTTPTVRVILTGSGAAAGDAVRLYAGDTALGLALPVTAADIAAGYIDLRTPVLVDGTTYDLRAAVVDASGTEGPRSAGGTFSIIVDTTAPLAPSVAAVTDDVAAVTGPVSDGGSTNDAQPTVRVSLTGSNAVAGDVVQLHDGSAALGAPVTLTAGDIAAGYVDLTTPVLTDGSTYDLRASVTDAAGNQSALSPAGAFDVTVDTTAPTVTITGIDISDDTGTSSSDFLTKEAAQTVTATLGDTLAADEDLYGSVDDGTTWLKITDKVSGTGISWDGVTLSGESVLRLEVRDAAGNAGPAATQGYTLDTTEPLAPGIVSVSDDVEPFTGPLSDGGSTNDETPTVRVSLTGSNATAGDTVQLYDGTTSLGDPVTLTEDDLTAGYLDITTPVLTDGSAYDLRASVTDAAGNESTRSTAGAFDLTVDTTAPTVTITGIDISDDTGTSSSDFLTREAAQTVTATLGDTLAADEDLYGSVDDGTTWLKITDKVSGTAVSWDGATLSGESVLRLEVRDAAGNAGPAATQAYTLDTTPPTIIVSGLDISDDTGALDTDFITRAASQTVTATLGDELGDGEELFGSVDDGKSWVKITGKVSGTAVSWDGATLSGESTLRLEVRDAAGNAGTPATQAYTLDTTAPGEPDITWVSDDEAAFTGPLADGDVTNDDTPTVRVGLSDTDAQAGDTVQLYDGTVALGGPVTLTEDDIEAGYLDITTIALSDDETYDLRASVIDIAGNESSRSTSGAYDIRIDTTAPVLTMDALSDGYVNAAEDDEALEVGGTTDAEVGRTVTVTVDGETYTGTVKAGEKGKPNVWTVEVPSAALQALAEGEVAVTADVSDAAGNAALQASGSFVYDATAPDAPVVAWVSDDVEALVGELADGDVTNDSTPKVRVSLAGTDAQAGDTVQLYDGTTVLGDPVTLSDDDVEAGYVEVTTDELTDGKTYDVRASVTDAAGNESALSAAGTFEIGIDTTAPNAPSISWVSDDVGMVTGAIDVEIDASTDDPTLKVRVSLEGTDALAGDAVQLYDSDDALGEAVVLTQADISDGYVDITTEELTSVSTYDLRASVTDAAGNESALSEAEAYLITVDTRPSVFSIARITADGMRLPVDMKAGDRFEVVRDAGGVITGYELNEETLSDAAIAAIWAMEQSYAYEELKKASEVVEVRDPIQPWILTGYLVNGEPVSKDATDNESLNAYLTSQQYYRYGFYDPVELEYVELTANPDAITYYDAIEAREDGVYLIQGPGEFAHFELRAGERLNHLQQDVTVVPNVVGVFVTEADAAYVEFAATTAVPDAFGGLESVTIVNDRYAHVEFSGNGAADYMAQLRSVVVMVTGETGITAQMDISASANSSAQLAGEGFMDKLETIEVIATTHGSATVSISADGVANFLASLRSITLEARGLGCSARMSISASVRAKTAGGFPDDLQGNDFMPSLETIRMIAVDDDVSLSISANGGERFMKSLKSIRLEGALRSELSISASTNLDFGSTGGSDFMMLLEEIVVLATDSAGDNADGADLDIEAEGDRFMAALTTIRAESQQSHARINISNDKTTLGGTRRNGDDFMTSLKTVDAIAPNGYGAIDIDNEAGADGLLSLETLKVEALNAYVRLSGQIGRTQGEITLDVSEVSGAKGSGVFVRDEDESLSFVRTDGVRFEDGATTVLVTKIGTSNLQFNAIYKLSSDYFEGTSYDNLFGYSLPGGAKGGLSPDDFTPVLPNRFYMGTVDEGEFAGFIGTEVGSKALESYFLGTYFPDGWNSLGSNGVRDRLMFTDPDIGSAVVGGFDHGLDQFDFSLIEAISGPILDHSDAIEHVTTAAGGILITKVDGTDDAKLWLNLAGGATTGFEDFEAWIYLIDGASDDWDSADILYLDTVAPVLTMDALSDGYVNAAEDDEALTVGGTTDAEVGRTVTVTVDGETYTGTVKAGEAGKPNVWTVEVPSAALQALAEGEVTVTADVSDAAGNAAPQASGSFVYDLTADVSDDLAVSFVDDPIDGAALSKVGLNLIGLDPDIDADDVLIQVTDGTDTVTASVVQLGEWSADLTGFEGTDLTVSVRVTDAAGNTAEGATDTATVTAPPEPAKVRATPFYDDAGKATSIPSAAGLEIESNVPGVLTLVSYDQSTDDFIFSTLGTLGAGDVDKPQTFGEGDVRSGLLFLFETDDFGTPLWAPPFFAPDSADAGTTYGLGSNGNDTLEGDYLWGFGGDDTLRSTYDKFSEFNNDNYLFGGAGNDTLISAGGADVMVGGAGRDFIVMGGNDIVVFTSDDLGPDLTPDMVQDFVVTSDGSGTVRIAIDAVITSTSGGDLSDGVSAEEWKWVDVGFDGYSWNDALTWNYELTGSQLVLEVGAALGQYSSVPGENTLRDFGKTEVLDLMGSIKVADSGGEALLIIYQNGDYFDGLQNLTYLFHLKDSGTGVDGSLSADDPGDTIQLIGIFSGIYVTSLEPVHFAASPFGA